MKRPREVLLILSREEHRRLVELTLPALASNLDDDTHKLVVKLINPREIQDIGDTDGNEESPQHQVTSQASCPRCRRPYRG